MRIFTLLFIFLLPVIQGNATSTLASAYGFNATDVTENLRAAITSAFDTVIIDRQETDWIVGSLHFFDLNNKTLIFESGVVVRAKTGAFSDPNACLFRFFNSENLNLIGYGAELRMNRAEYAALDDSEYRHALSLWSCRNVRISGLTLKESGGDGIYIGGETSPGVDAPCRNIEIDNVDCVRNYRQGMSVANVIGLNVRNSRFRETVGTLPEAGVDLEPYLNDQFLRDVLFTDCSFTQNGWAGIAVALEFVNGTTPDVNIRFVDCYLSGNRRPENTYGFTEIFVAANGDSPVGGELLFERVLIDGSDWTAFYGRTRPGAFTTTFRDCVFRDVSRQQLDFNNPIWLEQAPQSTQPSNTTGPYTFENLTLSYATDFTPLRAFELDTVKEFTLNWNRFSPQDQDIQWDESFVDPTVNVSGTYAVSPTPAIITFSADTTLATECDGSELVVSTTATSSAEYARPILRSWGGVASPGNDYDFLPPGAILTPGSTSANDTITARADELIEGPESLLLTLRASEFTNGGSGDRLTVYLDECAALNLTYIARHDKLADILLVNEEPFLPIGFYAEGMTFGEFPDIPERLAAGGFNIVYTESTVDELPRYDRFLRACDSLGLKNILGTTYGFLSGEEEFGVFINRFIDYPSVICWNLLDDANNFDEATIAFQRELLYTYDQTRLTSTSWYTTGPLERMLPYVDLAGMQAYPWGNGGADLAASQAVLRDLADTARLVGTYSIGSPQAFNWDDETYPSAAHLDVQSYQSLAAGTRGLIFYTFKDYDANSTIDITQPEIFATASKIADEVLNSELKDAILYGDFEATWINFYRNYGHWDYGDHHYYVVVNTSATETFEYDIPLPLNAGTTAENMFADRPDSLRIENGRLIGQLSPYQPAIYRVAKQTSNVSSPENRPVALYPNPTAGNFRFSDVNLGGDCTVFDVTGAVVKQLRLLPGMPVNLHEFPAGMYSVRVKATDGRVVTARVRVN